MDFNHQEFFHNELHRVGAILPGHFRLKGESRSAKRHGQGYIDKHEILKDVNLSRDLAEVIANRFKKERIDIVIGPETGGMLFARNVAHALLGKSASTLRVLFAEEREQGMFRLRDEDVDEVLKKRVLVIEDIITTGHTVVATIEAVNAWGGDVVGVGAICNRETLPWETFPIPEDSLFSVVNLQMQSWPVNRCGLCEESFPIDTPSEKRAEMRNNVISAALGSSI